MAEDGGNFWKIGIESLVWELNMVKVHKNVREKTRFTIIFVENVKNERGNCFLIHKIV